MDVLTENIEKDPPLATMFADDLVLCAMTREFVDAELPTVTSFKYLGSLFTGEGGSQADVNNRIRIGWMKWMEVSGVMCDRKMPVEVT